MKQLLFGVLLIGSTSFAFAEEKPVLCVYCEKPQKAYRCSVIGAGALNPQITRMYCIVRTAKEQQHESCRIKKVGDTLCLNSTEVTYLYEGPNVPGLTTKKRSASEIDRLTQKNHAIKQRNEPGTLVEFTQKSLSQSKQNLNKVGAQTKHVLTKTGQVIGKGAKDVGGVVTGAGNFLVKSTVKTVKCIFTLFNKCSDAVPQPVQPQIISEPATSTQIPAPIPRRVELPVPPSAPVQPE